MERLKEAISCVDTQMCWRPSLCFGPSSVRYILFFIILLCFPLFLCCSSSLRVGIFFLSYRIRQFGFFRRASRTRNLRLTCYSTYVLLPFLSSYICLTLSEKTPMFSMIYSYFSSSFPPFSHSLLCCGVNILSPTKTECFFCVSYSHPFFTGYSILQ